MLSLGGHRPCPTPARVDHGRVVEPELLGHGRVAVLWPASGAVSQMHTHNAVSFEVGEVALRGSATHAGDFADFCGGYITVRGGDRVAHELECWRGVALVRSTTDQTGPSEEVEQLVDVGLVGLLGDS